METHLSNVPGMGLVWMAAVPVVGFRGFWRGVEGSASAQTPDLPTGLAWARSLPAEGIMLWLDEHDGWHLVE